MAQETKRIPPNMLTAEELLENKGLKYNAWEAFEKSAKTLPKIGMKQFEPNNSWLENMQIEKGIMSRKDLIAIERVDRISQLASAEWLPEQRRAKVMKQSGQDWSSFGLEKCGTLYLLPEEALFLLEANCLELTWNSVPLSIQQAYDLLIDNVECSMEEYRVYNQLVRYGYRIQRFIYHSDTAMRSSETSNIKRKVIVEPENGLWMSDTQQQTQSEESTCNKNSQMDQTVEKRNEDIANKIYEVVDDLLSAVENIETQPTNIESNTNSESQEKSNLSSQPVNTNAEKVKRKSKVEIISEETLLGNFKIIMDRPKDDNAKGSNATANWRASRIQRNVKLLPKRRDKIISSTDNSDSNGTSSEQNSGKHKLVSCSTEDQQAKKTRHEVIELSDDEIQEVPKPKTRMELLNLIPNIASQTSVTIKISRGYIPHNIKPCKTSYHYESTKLRHLHQTDKNLRSAQNVGHSNSNTNNTPQCNNTSNNSRRYTNNYNSHGHNFAMNFNNVLVEDYYSVQHGHHGNYSPSCVYNNRMPYGYIQNLNYCRQRNTVFHNVFVALDNYNAVVQNRFTAVQTNNISVPNVSNNVIRNFFTRNQSYNNMYQNFMPLRRLYHHRFIENLAVQYSGPRNILPPEPRQRYWPRNHHRNYSHASHHRNEVYHSSFKVLPGASSWSDLKTKWREEKTITIDDDDAGNDDDEVQDCNEVQVVKHLRSPLVGPKNANSLEQVFSRLRIIKSAPEKIVRRRKSRYKISYNVYSNTQNYRKANPGLPFYRVVVIRHDDLFIQPNELQRLLQDAGDSPIVLACVSMSISYIQPGFISVPNLT